MASPIQVSPLEFLIGDGPVGAADLDRTRAGGDLGPSDGPLDADVAGGRCGPGRARSGSRRIAPAPVL